jgi:small subunit ribosomal protein S6e
MSSDMSLNIIVLTNFSEVTQKNGKTTMKRPAIQRLVTPLRLQRKRHLQSLKKRRTEAQKETVKDFKALIAKHTEEKKAANAAVRAQKKAKR